MKRKFLVLLLMFLTAALLLAGCGSGSGGGGDEEPQTSISSNDDNTVTINTNKTGAGTGGLAYITVGENEVLSYDSSLEKGSEIELKFYPSTVSDDEDEEMEKSMEDVLPDDGEETVTVLVGSGDSGYVELAPGEYTIGVNVTKKSTGTVNLSTQAQ